MRNDMQLVRGAGGMVASVGYGKVMNREALATLAASFGDVLSGFEDDPRLPSGMRAALKDTGSTVGAAREPVGAEPAALRPGVIVRPNFSTLEH